MIKAIVVIVAVLAAVILVFVDAANAETCVHASWYGPGFHGKKTANGERFDQNAMTAAHKTMKFGTVLNLVNPANGKKATVRINDRGPFIKGRSLDVSRAAAVQLGLIEPGVGRVCY